MHAFCFALYPAITEIIHGLAAPEKLWLGKQSALAADASFTGTQRNVHCQKAARSRTKLLATETLAAAPGELYQVSQQCSFAFFDIKDTLDATARPTDQAEKGNNRACTALANAFKAELGVMAVLQRTSGISSEHTRLWKQISDRLTSPRRQVCYGDGSTRRAVEGNGEDDHVAACSGANATDGTDAMRPWGFDGLALEKPNKRISSVELIPAFAPRPPDM